MSVHRFTLLVDDPEPALQWLESEIPDAVVRKRADSVVLGWTVRVALDDEASAARFSARWSADFHDLQLPLRQRKWQEVRGISSPSC